MNAPPELTDRAALARNQARARRAGPAVMFVHSDAVDEIKQRLDLVNRSFKSPAVVTAFPELWAGILPDTITVPDADILDLTENSHDLVIHAMALHWANDPVGQLVQARRALKPDGLFLGIFFGGQTLIELRTCLREAEVEITGGLSPRIAPMGEISELGSLLQRAGFALPVADAISLTASYPSARKLMHDLRAMGEANAMAARSRKPLRRAVLDEVERRYVDAFGKDGRITATFELIVLTGWAPSADQPQPLRPGSATSRLADALKTREHVLGAWTEPDEI